MMKHLFLLQEVYGVCLGYDFDIYTYGPFSSEVMSDINFAELFNFITVDYNVGANGYKINPTDKEDIDKEFSKDNSEVIIEEMNLFKDKGVKALELLTTIVYLHKQAAKNEAGWNREKTVTNVHALKPHYDLENDIIPEYDFLEKAGVLTKLLDA